LPKAVQDSVIGKFVINFDAPAAEVQSRSMDLIEQVAQQREVELVDQVVANWKRGQGAAVGLSDTLAAVQEHRAAILLIAAGYGASGYRCQSCRYLMIAERDECPLCGGGSTVRGSCETITTARWTGAVRVGQQSWRAVHHVAAPKFQWSPQVGAKVSFVLRGRSRQAIVQNSVWNGRFSQNRSQGTVEERAAAQSPTRTQVAAVPPVGTNRLTHREHTVLSPLGVVP
jgi:RNA polymerase subunit RPABC4/transcription elongation factor Spt4